MYVQRYDEMLSEYVFEVVNQHKERLAKARPSMKEKMQETRAKLNL